MDNTAFLEKIDFYMLLSTRKAPDVILEPFTLDERFQKTCYFLAEFPAIYDMFGKFEAELDEVVLIDQPVYGGLYGWRRNYRKLQTDIDS